MLNPFIVGRWDGNHVWLQWEPTEANEYALKLRYFREGGAEWGPWMKAMFPWPYRRHWVKIPTHKQGWRVMAMVAPWVKSEDKETRRQGDKETRGSGPAIDMGERLDWETANAAEFGRSTALFEFASGMKVTLPPNSTFIAMVDGATTSFESLVQVDVPADYQPVRSPMRAVQSSGLNQLDHAEHFEFHDPVRDLRVVNVEPTTNDLKPHPGDGGVLIQPARIDGPFTLAMGKINRPRV